jgi:hypothetical protein
MSRAALASLSRQVQHRHPRLVFQSLEAVPPAATTIAVSYSPDVIRTTALPKSALAFSAGSICGSTALIAIGGSHSSTPLSKTPLVESPGYRRVSLELHS